MGKNTSFSVIVGTTAEVTARYLAGDADLLLAHDSPIVPAHESLAAQEKLVLRQDRFLPYARRDAGDFGFPGSAKGPFPLIAYAQRAYFAQLVEHILARAATPPAYRVAVQCDMTDVLKEVIVAGYGVGWLPESAVDAARDQITPVGGPEWELSLDICAFRPRRVASQLIQKIWSALATGAQ
jgi:DNA-binding transcriptional LysR family regulator